MNILMMGIINVYLTLTQYENAIKAIRSLYCADCLTYCACEKTALWRKRITSMPQRLPH